MLCFNIISIWLLKKIMKYFNNGKVQQLVVFIIIFRVKINIYEFMTIAERTLSQTRSIDYTCFTEYETLESTKKNTSDER